MSNRVKRFGLILFYVIAIFFAGCFPEPGNSLNWSDDGSIGLLSVEGALYLVNGQTDELTEIEKENVQAWPGISRDGSLVVYSQVVECNDLSEGLKMLPAGQVKMIQFYAKKMNDEILKAGGLSEGKFPMSEGYLKNWAVRYMCENADEQLLKVVKKEEIQKGMELEISLYQIVVVPVKKLEDKKVIAASALKIIATQLSPDCKLAAYLMAKDIEDVDEPMYSLYVVSLETDVKAMLIARLVAFSYDWRDDSRAIAYLKCEAETYDSGDEAIILGNLTETTIADANDVLMSKLSDIPQEGLIQTDSCTGKSESLAGGYFFPWMKVQYGTGGRIFFSSVNWTLPTSKMELSEGWSVFCYDSATGTVDDILPLNVQVDTMSSLYVMQFALSPDRKKVLLPILQYNFIIYELGKEHEKIIAKEQDDGGDDVPELFPAWKGNGQISCIAFSDSGFVPEQAKEKFKRDEEIVILKANGEFDKILSENWPLEEMGKTEK